MPKRGENIHKRKDGRWEGRYKRMSDSSGKSQYGSVYGKTYSEVKGKLRELNQQQILKFTPSGKERKFREVLILWKETHHPHTEIEDYVEEIDSLTHHKVLKTKRRKWLHISECEPQGDGTRCFSSYVEQKSTFILNGHIHKETEPQKLRKSIQLISGTLYSKDTPKYHCRLLKLSNKEDPCYRDLRHTIGDDSDRWEVTVPKKFQFDHVAILVSRKRAQEEKERQFGNRLMQADEQFRNNNNIEEYQKNVVAVAKELLHEAMAPVNDFSEENTIVLEKRHKTNMKNIEIKITNTDEVIPTLSGWKTETADGNGDETKHTATITYSSDGDYTFAIAYADEAGNDNEKVNYGESLAPEKFTVDKTLPTVTVTYDNNEVLNGNYYKAQRIATIVVTEHNFETSRVKIALKATDNGVEAALPTVSNWSSNGDVHTATITYAADSLYTFDFDYNDKAGNATADIAEQAFYVDKTNPAVSISKIVDQSANNDEGNIGFVVTATDTNFDVFTPVLTVTDIKGGSTKLNVGATTDIANGKTYSVENLDADGIYRITCTVVDKAGNAYSEVTLQRADGSTYVEKRAGEDTLVTFSVNRDGSTYEINKNTASLIEKYYVQNVTDNVVIVETNADVLNEYKVTLNGKELAKDTDYTVAESGGNGQWMKYTYTVNKTLFADEGEYKLVVSSKDKAENDAFSDVKDTTINFVVDRTAPIVTITGMAKDGRYQTESQKVTLVPTDDGGALKTLIVRLVDEDGKVIGEPIIDLAGEALEKALEDGAGKIEFTIAEGLLKECIRTFRLSVMTVQLMKMVRLIHMMKPSQM